MIRIAVVDDDSIYIERIEKYFRIFFQNNELEYKISKFTSGKEFMDFVKKDMYDIYILDIDMPEISGIDIAKYVRRFNSDVTIIFITNMDNLVFESIKYSPYRFIRKVKMNEEMPELLDALKAKYANEGMLYIFTYNGESKSVKINDIIYFESYDHDIFLHLSNGEKYKTNDTLNNLIEKLEIAGFIKIHKSFIVNFRYIYEFNRGHVILIDHSELPVSKNRVKEIKKEFINFNRRAIS